MCWCFKRCDCWSGDLDGMEGKHGKQFSLITWKEKEATLLLLLPTFNLIL